MLELITSKGNSMFMKTLKKQAGLGLVEVMVAASILGGLSLVVMKLNESGVQGVSRVEKSMDIVQFDGEINNYMATQEGCLKSIQSAGAPVTLASITSPAQYEFRDVIDRNDVLRFHTVHQRGQVSLTRMYVSSYGLPQPTGPGAGNAYLFKIFSFKLSPTQTVTKTRRITLAIKTDGTDVTGCMTRATETDSVWIVDDSGFGIYYQTGTVAIGTEVPSLVPISLNVQGGDILLGGAIDNNSLMDAFPQNNQMLGGEENVLANGVTDSVMMNGNQNSILSGSSVLTLGGFQNIAEGNFSTVINSPYTVVQNTVGGGGSSALGGSSNIIIGKGAAAIGGYANIINTGSSDARGSAVIGGYLNQITGDYAYNNIVLGGANNTSIGNDGNNNDTTSQAILVSSSSYINSGWNNKIIAAELGRIDSGVNHVIVGGNSNGFLAGGVGGQRGIILGGDTNSSTAGNNIAIVGGSGNRVDVVYSAALGGMQNVISGVNNSGSTVIGGERNIITGSLAFASTIIGGNDNTIESNTRGGAAIINSGYSRVTENGFVAGGGWNQINSWNSAIVGGTGHSIGAAASFAGIFGGAGNVLLASRSVITGGHDNTISIVGTTGNGSGIFAGRANIISGATATTNTILGGNFNTISAGNSAAIVGGYANMITGNPGGFIGGGTNNVVGSSGARSAIIGGSNNYADGNGGAVVLGGNANYAIGNGTIVGGLAHTANTWGGGIIGGIWNTIAGGQYSFILGGLKNKVFGGDRGVIIGGSFMHIQAAHSGSVMIGDWKNEMVPDVMLSSNSNQFSARFANGYRLCGNSDCTNGMALGPSSGTGLWTSWAAPSDRNLKEDFREINEDEILQKVSELWVPSWVYKAQEDKSKRIIGPMAQDFYRLFSKSYGLGSNNKMLLEKDVEGVLLLSVKALKKENDELKNRVKSLEEEMEEIRAEMRQMKNR